MAEDKTFEGGLPIGAGFYPRSKGYFLLRSEDVQVDGSKSLADYIEEGGGGSGGESTETDPSTIWLINEEPDPFSLSTGLSTTINVSFTSNGTLYSGIGIVASNASNAVMFYLKSDGTDQGVWVGQDYPFGTPGWIDEAYRTIITHEEITDEALFDWLLTNATPMGNGDQSAEMPIIRFVGLSSDNGQLQNPTEWRFTVEVVGGGTLLVGDYLELCAMRTCKRPESDISAGKKRQRLRKLYSTMVLSTQNKKVRLDIPAEEAGLLYKNDRKLVETGDCRSPIYLRIKRPFYDAYGNENFAKFSNIIRLEKSYSLNYRSISVK